MNDLDQCDTYCDGIIKLEAENAKLRTQLKLAETREQIIRDGINSMRAEMLRQNYERDENNYIVNDFLGIFYQAERDIEADLQVIINAVNGIGNWYHSTWTDAEVSEKMAAEYRLTISTEAIRKANGE